MKVRNLFRLFLLCALILSVIDAYPRAGGGSSGGGGSHGGGYSGHGYSHSDGYSSYRYNSNSRGRSSGAVGITLLIIITVLAVVVLGTIPALIKLKSHASAKIITRASNKDSLWDADRLKKHAEKIFYKMQRAWEDRSMGLVKKQVTVELFTDYKSILDQMLKNREKNIITFITLTEITIIGCEDFKDDSKDRYIAYIKGTMLDYTINERSKEIIQNPKRLIRPFSDTYHFVRSYNDWLLEKINNTVKFEDIIRIKNSIEV